MVTPIFRHRTEPLTAIDPSPCADTERWCKPENTLNTVSCCVTDLGKDRISWEWRQGHGLSLESQMMPLLRSDATPTATDSSEAASWETNLSGVL
jgi:hypothetical protein